MSSLLKPLGHVYGGLMTLRNLAYDQSWLAQQSFSTPIVSIGNLTVGGTGKTPFTSLLLSHLEKEKFQVGVVSRGYKGAYRGVVEVTLGSEWREVGDEPKMLKMRHQDVPIYLCRERARAVSQLCATHSLDLILADDAFQHRALHRNLDIVLFDATQPQSIYEMLPAGRLREPLSQLCRAKWMVVTKQNLISREKKEESTRWFEELAHRYECNVLFADLEVSGLTSKKADQILPLGRRDDGKVYLVSGIGSPETFTKSVKQDMGLDIAHHFVFPDHHAYTKNDLKRILEVLKPKDILLTTEKDFIRLQEYSDLEEYLRVLRVDFSIRGSVNEFWNQIYCLVR